MNAIWTHYLDYALSHNLREQQGLNDMLRLILNDVGIEYELSGSAKNMVALPAQAGTEYVMWWKERFRPSSIHFMYSDLSCNFT